MQITYKWLKEYVDIKAPPEELAHLLTMAGSEIKSIDKKKEDCIFEVEITPNRSDCLSMIGLAREVAAITGEDLKLPKTTIIGETVDKGLPIAIEVQAKELCPRYSGRIISNVAVGNSPAWLEERLKSVGLRPVNNIVDITNFCLFETGQPMHAFDYDKIEGRKIVVRNAKKGENIITIDGVKRELSPDMLIIANEKRPIAVAGVMGGLNTEVTGSTKNILLESAYFDPISVRLTSRKLGISSESSYRFERGVDTGSVVSASNRATLLINELAGGKEGILIDKNDIKYKPTKISYDVKYASKLLGCEISNAESNAIFKSLGFETRGSGNKLKIEIPSFRRDLKYEVDLIEEAARIYGYEKVPSTIPEMVSQISRKTQARTIQDITRELLTASGLYEIITYSLISRNLLSKLRPDNVNVISVANPLSAEQEVIRPSIVPGMLNTVLWNINRKINSLKFFELGNIYGKEKEVFKESLNLTIAMTGNAEENWRQKRKLDFFDLKGVIEMFLQGLGVENPGFCKGDVPYLSKGESAVLKIGDKTIGSAGKLEKEILAKFGLKQDVYIAELNMEEIASAARLGKAFQPLPRFPFVIRDVSIVLDKNVLSSEIISAIRNSGVQSIIKAEIFDEYNGEQIPKDKKGLSISIVYQDKNKTLTDQEVDQLHSKIRELLAQKFSAQFR